MYINPNYFDSKGRWRWGDLGYPTCAAFHPRYTEDELFQYLAVGYSDGGGIKLFFVHTEDPTKPWLELVHIFPMGNSCNCLFWSPDGVRLVALGNDNFIRHFDVTINRESTPLACNEYAYSAKTVAFSPDGERIVSVSGSTLLLWNSKTGTLIKDFDGKGHTDYIRCVAFSPDGRTIVSGSKDSNLHLWDALSGIQVPGFNGKGNEKEVSFVAFNNDGKYIVIARDWGVTLELWDVQNGTQILGFDGKGHKDFYNKITFAVFSPDGSTIVSGGSYGNLKFFDARNGTLIPGFEDVKIADNSGEITFISFSPDSELIIAGDDHNNIQLFKTLSGLSFLDLGRGRYQTPVNFVSFSPDGRSIASGHKNGDLKLWDTLTGSSIAFFSNDNLRGEIKCLSFSPDGRMIALGLSSGSLECIDIRNHSNVIGFDGYTHTHVEHIASLSFSPDTRTIVSTGYNDGFFLLRDAQSGIPIPVYDENGNTRVNTIAFSPDGKTIVSGDFDMALKLWDTQIGTQLPGFDGKGDKGFSEFVKSVAFSPDGKTIVSSGDSGKPLILWDAKSGMPISGFNIKEHTPTVTSVVFSPDGKTIASGDWGCTIKLWDAQHGSQIHDFKSDGHKNSLRGRYHDEKAISIAFSPNGRYIVSGSEDGTIILWSLAKILGREWLEEHMATPLVLTPVWFPERSLSYMEETKQGNVVRDLPLVRCGECGQMFPVKESQLDKEIRCPMNNEIGKACNRLLKINPFIAGERE